MEPGIPLTTYYVAYLPIYYLSRRHICSVLSKQYHAIQYVCSSLHNVRCRPNYPVALDASHGTCHRQSGYHSLPREIRLHVRCRCLLATKKNLGFSLEQQDILVLMSRYILIIIFEPRCEKTGLRGFRPGQTQAGLYSHRG